MVSHALVTFFGEDDQPTCIVPVKRLKECVVRDLKKGDVCSVEWTNKQVYPAKVISVGEYSNFFVHILMCMNAAPTVECKSHFQIGCIQFLPDYRLFFTCYHLPN